MGAPLLLEWDVDLNCHGLVDVNCPVFSGVPISGFYTNKVVWDFTRCP